VLVDGAEREDQFLKLFPPDNWGKCNKKRVSSLGELCWNKNK
jgi:hypothetical protein